MLKHRDKYAVNEPYNSEEETPKNSPINKWLCNHGKPKLGEQKQADEEKTKTAKKKQVLSKMVVEKVTQSAEK